MGVLVDWGDKAFGDVFMLFYVFVFFLCFFFCATNRTIYKKNTKKKTQKNTIGGIEYETINMQAFFWSSIAIIIIYRIVSTLNMNFFHPTFYKRLEPTNVNDNKHNSKEIELHINENTKKKEKEIKTKDNKKTYTVKELKNNTLLLSFMGFFDCGIILEVWNGHVRNDTEMSGVICL